MRVCAALAVILLAACPDSATGDSDASPDSTVPDADAGDSVTADTPDTPSDATDSTVAETVDTHVAPAGRLTFEAVTLDPTPAGITELRFVPRTEDQLVLLDKAGTVHHYALQGDTATRQGTFVVPDVDDIDDCGLISLAFDPDWGKGNHYVFAGHCIDRYTSRITRMVFDGTNYADVAGTAVTIIEVGDPDAKDPWHNVGTVDFDPDGTMWALFGDKTVSKNGQDASNNLGALVRIVPSREEGVGGYSQAAGNPLAAQDGVSPDVYAYGLRSPWRGYRDALGRYWIGDVGPAVTEEVNLAVYGGENFGWADHEGPCESGCGEYTQPLLWWDREDDHPYALEDEDTVPTARRVVYVGLQYESAGQDRYDGQLDGWMIYGDFCAGWVRAVATTPSGDVLADQAIGHLEGPVGWARGSDGYIYVATYGNCFPFPYKPGALWRARLAE